jgi:hypothetical protein
LAGGCHQSGVGIGQVAETSELFSSAALTLALLESAQFLLGAASRVRVPGGDGLLVTVAGPALGVVRLRCAASPV